MVNTQPALLVLAYEGAIIFLFMQSGVLQSLQLDIQAASCLDQFGGPTL